MYHNNHDIGNVGEQIASDFLQKKGYHILAKNFLIRGGELDIIALTPKKDTLVFVEVKTRSSSDYGSPLEAITPWKLKSVIKAAQFYSMSHPNLPESLRIDAIAIALLQDGSIGEIEHHESITS